MSSLVQTMHLAVRQMGQLFLIQVHELMEAHKIATSGRLSYLVTNNYPQASLDSKFFLTTQIFPHERRISFVLPSSNGVDVLLGSDAQSTVRSFGWDVRKRG